MRLGWLASPMIHAAMVGVLFIAPPLAPLRDAALSEIVPVEVVSISEVSNIAPIAAPEPKPDSLTPEVIEGAPQELSELAPPPEALKPDQAPQKKPPPPNAKPQKLNLDQLSQMVDKRAEEAGARDAAAPKGRQPQPGERPRRGVGVGDGFTATEEDAIRAQMRQCWRMPLDMAAPEKLVVQVRVRFEASGQLSAPPELVSPKSPSDPAARAAVEAALRAVRLCNPLRVNPARTSGGAVVLSFDPREMAGG